MGCSKNWKRLNERMKATGILLVGYASKFRGNAPQLKEVEVLSKSRRLQKSRWILI
jgi:hypothetical protein